MRVHVRVEHIERARIPFCQAENALVAANQGLTCHVSPTAERGFFYSSSSELALDQMLQSLDA